MRKKLTCAIAVSICACTLMQNASLTTYANNPICSTAFAPDPAPVVFGDELWVFTGCDKDARNDNYYMVGWQAFSTTDMQNWTNHGMILKDNEFSWCTENNAWASQCIERNGKYYFYFTTTDPARGREIGVGVADNPEGPYKDVLGKPLCGPDWAYIDPTVIIDDDGQAWLMFGNPDCYYVKLKEDMVTLDGQIQKFNLSLPAGTKYGEGPWIYKHDSLYYLVFASFVDAFGGESISYCTGPSVTGPWTFRGNIHEGSNCFTTHGGIIDYKGHSYSFYHMNGLPGGGSFNRSAACEEFTYGSDGSIPALKSTKNGPDQIEAFNPYRRVEAETMAWSEGVKVESAGNGSQALGFIENGDYVMLKGVDFGEGATEFITSVASDGEGGKIELHLDSATGPIVGTATCPVTGGWQEFTEVSGNVVGATGKHDLYLRFSGSDGYLFNVDWWEFKGAGSSASSGQGNTTSKVLGDLDNDEVITAKDLSLAHQEYKIFQAFSGTSFKSNADVNGNGQIEKDDFQWYVKFLTGQTKDYPEKAVQTTTAPPATTPAPTTTTTAAPVKSNYQYKEIKFHEAPGYYFNGADHKGRVVNESYNGINGGNKLNV
ncbi:MAG: family 43 glycosylhydrolase, partial [Oscillospiraceae bacterium]|nr:family 43 glycosylhydrolase [Oscillospiraceae bacterium]